MEIAAEVAQALLPNGCITKISDVEFFAFIRAPRSRWPLNITARGVVSEGSVEVSISSKTVMREIEHARMRVHVSAVVETGPLIKLGRSSRSAPNTYAIQGSRARLSGMFSSIQNLKLEPYGGSADLKLDLSSDSGILTGFTLPSVALDCMLRTCVLDGRNAQAVKVIVPTRFDSVEFYSKANDHLLRSGYPGGLYLYHWLDASDVSHCAITDSGGFAVVVATGVSGVSLGAFSESAGQWTG
jgi:hypothetical protein